MHANAAATAGSAALTGSKGAHPTLRLDSFLRSTDTGYRHGEAPTQGDRFIRKMATYGQVRPSVSFTAESRVTRPHRETSAVDMSNLPACWNDPRGEAKEGMLEHLYPNPPAKCDMEFIKLYENKTLMLPSERYKEHLQMKAAEKKWREDRDKVFSYRKRQNVLQRKHPEGVVGIDGPLFEGTKLYAERNAHLANQAEYKAAHAEARHNNIAQMRRTDDATACKLLGSEPELGRSKDVCIPRKCIDPQVHPWRFLDTHDRLFPGYTATWDPERAQALRSHQVRDKRHCIISGNDNTMEYRVAPSWEENLTLKMAAQSQQMSQGSGAAGP